MVKCPNCGSTAQMRLFDTERCGHHLAEYGIVAIAKDDIVSCLS